MNEWLAFFLLGLYAIILHSVLIFSRPPNRSTLQFNRDFHYPKKSRQYSSKSFFHTKFEYLLCYALFFYEKTYFAPVFPLPAAYTLFWSREWGAHSANSIIITVMSLCVFLFYTFSPRKKINLTLPIFSLSFFLIVSAGICFFLKRKESCTVAAKWQWL